MSTMASWERARRKSINNRQLLIAVSRNQLEDVQRLTDQAVDVNFKDQDGYSALSLAAEFADSKVVQLLRQKGADLDVKNNDEESPLDIARRLNRLDIVGVLETAIDEQSCSIEKSTLPTDDPETKRRCGEDNNGPWTNSVYKDIYRLKALLLFLKRSLARKCSFRLAFEGNARRQLDRLLLATSTTDNKKKYRLLLAKHKIDETEKITVDKLIADVNGDYNLIKYYRLYQACKTDYLRDGTIEDITICTNIDVDADNLKRANVTFRKIEEKDEIAVVKSKTKLPARYKFGESSIARLIAETKGCKLNKKHYASSRDIREFLEHFILAVNQPNEEELASIAKKEIGKEFDCLTTQRSYDHCLARIADWTKARKTLLSWSEGVDLLEYLKKTSLLWYNVQDPCELFTGRREQLASVHGSLQVHSTICISGLSGVGKSEFVKKYASEYAHCYDNRVVWLDAQTHHTLVNSFHKLATDKLAIGVANVDAKEKDANSLVSEVYQYFSKGKSLFIFDHFGAHATRGDLDAGIDKFLPRLSDHCHKPHIIVTCPRQRCPANVKVHALDVFEERETIDFASESLNLKSDEEREQIAELGKELGSLPLALQLAVSHISVQRNRLQSSFSMSDYRRRLSGQIANRRESSDPEDECAPIVETMWNVITDDVKRQDNCRDAFKLLNLLSYFLPDNVPVKTLLIFFNDRRKLASLIEVLHKYSLIRVHHKALSIPRAIQRASRTKLLENNEEETTLEEILKSIESSRINSENVDHFLSIWSYSKKYIYLVETYHCVFSLITGELTSCGRIEEAHSMGIELVELLNPLSDNSNVQSGLMNMKSRLGDILLRQGKYEAALREFEELYETEIGLKGSTDNKTLDTKSDIALALQKLGKTEEALRCYREILEVRRVTLGESHCETLSIKSHVATVLMEQEKYDEALPIFEHVYNAQKATLGDNHYDTLMTRNSMAALFLFQRRHEEALQIFQDIYNARNDTLFENHPALLVARQNIATTLQRQKKYDLALDVYEEVYNIQKDLLGEDHPEVLAIRGEIALTTHMLGKPNEALAILQQVFERQSEVLGLYHPLVLRTQFFMAHNLEEQCRYSEALPIYQELLKVGISATGVASMHLKLHNSIGSILMLQGNVDKALKHYEEALKINDDTLGSNHPQTLIAKSNVGSLYYKKKDYDKALSILRQVHQTEQSVFGKAHETCNSTYHFINKILFEKQLRESQIRRYAAQSPSDEPLIAVESGDLALLKRLVKKGASVNTRDASKKTLLHHAARLNRLEMVKFLLNKGADATCASDKGKTPLHVAVVHNHLEIADELLRNTSHEQSRGLIDAATTASGNTALHVASKNGFHELMKLLLSRGATYSVSNNDAKRPVELAKSPAAVALLNDVDAAFELARSGTLECRDELQRRSTSDYSAIVNARDRRGYNLTQVAIVNDRRELVRSLGLLAIARSRDVDSPASFDLNLEDVLPLATCALTRLRDEACATKVALKHARKLVATVRSHDKRVPDRNVRTIQEICSLLKSRKEDEALAELARVAVASHLQILKESMYSVKLLEAAKRNDLRSVDRCVRECANVNVVDEGGWTALLHAANAGNEQMVKLLLDNGACVNRATNTGKNTSLHVAVNKGHLAIAKSLLERDATSEFINAKTEAKGSTAMHIAAKIGCLDSVTLLLANGAIYCLPNKDGQLPVDLTGVRLVRAFFEVVDELFYDAKNGRAEIIRKLQAMERGQFLAVISACNDEEFTLANVAASQGHGELADKIAAIRRL